MFDVFLRNLSLSEIRLGLSATFTHSPETALNNIKARDINIILGFFGPHDARNILCMVSTIELLLIQFLSNERINVVILIVVHVE